jgi:hypothetical protein
MEKTSIEWLLEEVNKLNISNEARTFLNKLGEKAKEKHKQEIIEAHGVKTKSINQDQSEIITGIKYYNEKYNK